VGWKKKQTEYEHPYGQILTTIDLLAEIGC